MTLLLSGLELGLEQQGLLRRIETGTQFSTNLGVREVWMRQLNSLKSGECAFLQAAMQKLETSWRSVPINCTGSIKTREKCGPIIHAGTTKLRRNYDGSCKTYSNGTSRSLRTPSSSSITSSSWCGSRSSVSLSHGQNLFI